MLRFSENSRRSGLSLATRSRAVRLSAVANARTALSTHGLVEATQSQAEGGTVTGRYMSPLRVAQAISGLTPLLGITATGSTTARTLPVRFGELSNVKDFGAVGDGATDDTTAINAAELALNSAGGGTLYFPEGTYIVTGVTKRTGTAWRGDGWGVTIIKMKAATTANAVIAGLNAYTLFGSAVTDAGIYDFSIENMTIDGNRVGGVSTCDGIGVYGFAYRIRNVEVQNCIGWGLTTEYGIDVDGGSLTGIHEDNASSYLEDCLIHDNNEGGVEWVGPQDSHISGNYIYRNLLIGFWARGQGVGLKLIGNHFWGSDLASRQAITNVFLDTLFNYLIGNTIEGATGQQVWIRSTNNTIIGGIIFYANATPNSVYGIRLGDAGNTLPTAANNIFTQTNNTEAGAVYFDSDNGLSTICVNGFNGHTSSTGYTGTPGSFSVINIAISGTSVTNPTLFRFPGTTQVSALRIDQTPTAVGTGTKTISNSADGSTNFGHYISISANGTTYYIPCSSVAPT